MSGKREWTAERHAAARDRCNRATSGPWKWWTSNSHRRLTAEDRQDGGVAYGTKHKDGCDDIVIGEHDMAFIEEARLDLPDALREIERLTDALACDRAILKARTDALDTAETCRESLRKGLEQASEQIAEMTAEAKVATAEIEQLRDTVHNYKALLAAAESAGREVCDERDAWKEQAGANAHGCQEQKTFREAAEAERDDERARCTKHALAELNRDPPHYKAVAGPCVKAHVGRILDAIRSGKAAK